MIILGIDPGNARLGYGLLKKVGAKIVHLAHGCFETDKGMQQADRLTLQYSRLLDLVDRHRPEVVGVEKLFFSKNVKTAMAVSEARGMILLAVRSAGARIAEFTPMEVKLAATGYGGADKRQMQEMVRVLLGLSAIPEPDDAADALAVAYCAAVSLPVVR